MTAPSDGGRKGERWAAEYLKAAKGFEILDCNWRNPRDRREEIDLIALDGEVLVFVEVKTRAAGAIVPGYFAVGSRKKAVLRRVCRSYLSLLSQKPRTFRLDVVEVENAPAGPIVRHFRNVPLFSKWHRE